MSIDVLSAVISVLERQNLLGRDLLVAVSGGLDSVCLYRLLCAVRDAHGGRLEVAHVDHARRDTSAADAEFCGALAERHGSRFHLLRADAGLWNSKAGFQGAARRVRREFFKRLLEERKVACIALGHHADDQVETVLYRLVRGAGLRGAAGMEEFAPPYLRPLLGVRRAELEDLAAGQGWEYREDPTNATNDYARNRLRHEVLPALHRVHPGAEAGVLRFAELAAADDRVLTRLARDELRRLSAPEAEGVRLPVAELAALDPALRRRLYLAAWEALCGSAEVLHADHLEAVDSLLEPGRAHRFAPTPGPGRFAVSYGDLWLLRPDSATAEPFSAPLPELGGPPLRTPAGALHRDEEVPGGRTGVAVPMDDTGEALVRSRRPGDRLGSSRSHKVKDLLIEARIPLWRRTSALVLECDARVCGVLGRGFAISKEDPVGGWVWLEPPARAARETTE